jgi:hypothetical protein
MKGQGNDIVRFQCEYVIATIKKAICSFAQMIICVNSSVNSTNIQKIHTVYPTCTLVPNICYL